MVEAHAANRSPDIAEMSSHKGVASLRSEVAAKATPTLYAPLLHGPTVPAQSGGDVHSSGDESSGGIAPKRGAQKSDKALAARKRELILQQLMAQHLGRSQREKLLRALIDLGISEQEYRSLVAKLGEMEVARLAQQQSSRHKLAQPIAVAQEVPALKEPAKTTQTIGQPDAKEPKASSPSSAQTTRAEIYKRLKEEASSKRKSA